MRALRAILSRRNVVAAVGSAWMEKVTGLARALHSPLGAQQGGRTTASGRPLRTGARRWLLGQVQAGRMVRLGSGRCRLRMSRTERTYSSLLVGVLVSISPAVAGANPIGEVVYATGAATVLGQAGTRPAKSARISEGERLRTGADGHIYLRTYDGGFFILRPNSEGVVLRYRTLAEPAQSAYRLELNEGLGRVVTGHDVKRAPERFRFNTPLAAIGVRGTDFTVLSQPELTRAWVEQGRIVVASLGEGCPGDALGPCANGEALELSPDKIAAAEIAVNARGPVPLPAMIQKPMPAVPTDAPEPASPAKPTRGNGAAATVLEPGVEALANPRVDPAPTLRWGRWQPLANLPADVKAADIVGAVLAINSSHILWRGEDKALTLPNEGQASFRLAAHEGFLIDAKGGISRTEASNGRLNLDFGQRRFETRLSLGAPGHPSIDLSAVGSVSPDGRFVSDVLSLTHVSGAVGGERAQEAAYLYQKRLDQDTLVSGATHWWR